MSALAIFVEGQTELIFVEQLLFKMLGYQHLRVVRQEQHGNVFHDIGVRGAPPENAEHNILLSNCSSDGKVLSAIVERAQLLSNANYDRVIGLRDIYPEPTDELDAIYGVTRACLATLPLPCEMIIAVREVEAWFLADPSHFERFNEALTAALILQRLGIDVSSQDVEGVIHPAGQLDSIYQLAGLSYDKKTHQAHAVVHSLDFDYLYLEARVKVPALNRFMDALDAVL